MARLSDIQGKSLEKVRDGAYARCFGDVELSRLLSRIQSLIIKNGHELENIIKSAVSDLLIQDLDAFLSEQIMEVGVRVAEKKTIKRSKTLKGKDIEPDFIVFERSGSSQRCFIVELKDGHEFDTKSSAKEQSNLQEFLSVNSHPLQYYQNYGKICGFNAQTREEIQTGFKGKIELNEAMTGQEFCELLHLDYRAIVDLRANDRPENLDQFISDLLNIPTVRDRIAHRLDDH